MRFTNWLAVSVLCVGCNSEPIVPGGGTSDTATTYTTYDTLTGPTPPCDNVHYGDYDIAGPEDIMDLEGICRVTGTLTIESVTLTDLAGLEELLVIGGYLAIHDNLALLNVDGLESLEMAGGVHIYENEAIVDLDGLSGLSNVVGPVYVQYNPTLESIDGLAGLTSVGGSVSVFDNDLLVGVAGLAGLSTLGGYLGIAGNAIRTSIDPFCRLAVGQMRSTLPR